MTGPYTVESVQNSNFLMDIQVLIIKHNFEHWPKMYFIYAKGQLNSEGIYEVIVSPDMQTKNYKDFCPTKQTRIVAKKTP